MSQVRLLNKRLLKLALPNILSNITVPLLGIVDLALAGHLNNVGAIGGVSVSSTIFNLIYWNFGFLRMGTTGLTAQAHGIQDKDAMGRNLAQSLSIGISFGLLILLFQSPLLRGLLSLLRPEPLVVDYATTYFNIVIWGAPAILCTYALNGWIIGMQNTWWPMLVSIVTNVTNILLSATLVIGYDWGIKGIATGTVIAQWLGFLLLLGGGWWLFLKKDKATFPDTFGALKIGIRRYFSTNVHILIRTMLLAFVSFYFTSAGTRMGTLTLSSNALLLQFATIFSYFIDGFAYAAEALVGHTYGQKDRKTLLLSIRILGVWGLALAVLVSLIYYAGGSYFIHFLTDIPEVRQFALEYIGWVYLLPITGFLAYLMDGIYVGLTATRQMMTSMFIAVGVFFLLNTSLPFSDPNNALWCAFVTYLLIRGVILTMMLPRILMPRNYIGVGTTFLETEEKIRQLLTSKYKNNIRLAPFYTTNDSNGSGREYLNTVAELRSSKAPELLRQELKDLEKKAGRGSKEQGDEVVLDLDLVSREDEVLRPKDYHQPYFQMGYKLLV